MAIRNVFSPRLARTLSTILLSLVLPATGLADVAQSKARSATTSVPPQGPGAGSRHQPDRFAGKAGRYYRAVWGVDGLKVKLAESGQLVRFSWTVLDPGRARTLHDKRLEPTLVDPQAGVSLVVPTMEKVGQLRQSTSPVEGKSYWMAFSNKGRHVKRGDRVNVVIGGFRADGLVVD